MIRLRYNGKVDKDFDMSGKPENVGDLVEFASLKPYTASPATVYSKPNQEISGTLGNLNCFDYVPSIVPDNVTHLTKEEITQWQTQAHKKYLIHLQ